MYSFVVILNLLSSNSFKFLKIHHEAFDRVPHVFGFFSAAGKIAGQPESEAGDFGSSQLYSRHKIIKCSPFAVRSVTGLIFASSLEKKYMINGEWKNLEELKATLKY
jgi:hypothetical protein